MPQAPAAAAAADDSAALASGDELLPLPVHLNVNKIVRQVRDTACAASARPSPTLNFPTHRVAVPSTCGCFSRCSTPARAPDSCCVRCFPLLSSPPHTQIKRADLGLYNCLRSIDADAEFVDAACAHHRPLPVFANLRCGLWYLKDPSAALTCYFKARTGCKDGLFPPLR